ncbi:MAG: hypothetical protein D3924_06265, partial [Candidatus Electrothrix sp. AR4]|nr:hypothetical protein [Candidatus Electrothrix sp. AR4]
MKIFQPISLAEIQEHEQRCDTSVLLGSHGMDQYCLLDEFRLYKAVLEPEDTDGIYLIDGEFVDWTSGKTGRVQDVEYEKIPEPTRKRIESFIDPSEQSGKRPVDLRFLPQFAITVVCAHLDGPWIIIDGNHRAIAHYQMYGSLTAVPAYVCVHSGIGYWRYIPGSSWTDARSQWPEGAIRYLEAECIEVGEVRESIRDAEETYFMRTEQRILNLCSRIEPHPAQQQRLAEACAVFNDWDSLLEQAEAHGMGPLLYRHLSVLKIELPDHLLRSLRLLCFRHRQTNILLTKTLGRVLQSLEAEGIPALVL